MMLSLFLFLALLPTPVEEPLMIYHENELIYSIDHQALQHPLLGTEMINHKQLHEIIRTIETVVQKPAKNATIAENGDMIAEENGYRLNHFSMNQLIVKYYYEHGSSKIDAPIIPTYPKVDTELLAHIKTNHISSFSTYFNKRNNKRSHNIKLAAAPLIIMLFFQVKLFHLIMSSEKERLNEVTYQRQSSFAVNFLKVSVVEFVKFHQHCTMQLIMLI
ncbi:conserved protein YoaR [Halalkalibacter hemicellulosilyticusJCM 9152]|uniref:Conserved protein YoaR n=1 Tax=Halalkalibacter hemicellulosilyticusJCM 9152 TaxID=1236971 RepID=W4QGX9_9BACI|nr:conserved protein YoaR [Halalkalibacter hemicellulosilyticusJCM 9152]